MPTGNDLKIYQRCLNTTEINNLINRLRGGFSLHVCSSTLMLGWLILLILYLILFKLILSVLNCESGVHTKLWPFETFISIDKKIPHGWSLTWRIQFLIYFHTIVNMIQSNECFTNILWERSFAKTDTWEVTSHGCIQSKTKRSNKLQHWPLILNYYPIRSQYHLILPLTFI